MAQGTSFDPILVTVVLATLAIGLPIVFILAIRFLWERQLSLGRSKDLDKLIWQLHRIASAMEHQMNVSFPAVQPGTEEARDLAFLQQPAAAKSTAPTGRVATANAAVPAPVVQPAQQAVAPQAAVQRPAPEQPAAQAQPPAAQEPAAAAAAEPPSAEPEPAFAPLVPHDPAAGPPRHAGVNSMFGF